MARTNDPNSTSQFFINTVDNSRGLDAVVRMDLMVMPFLAKWYCTNS